MLASWSHAQRREPHAATRFLSGPGRRYTATPDYVDSATGRRLRAPARHAWCAKPAGVQIQSCAWPDPRKRCSSRGAWRDTFMAWRSRTRTSAGFAALARRTRSKPRSTLDRGEGRPTRKTSSPPTDGAEGGLTSRKARTGPATDCRLTPPMASTCRQSGSSTSTRPIPGSPLTNNRIRSPDLSLSIAETCDGVRPPGQALDEHLQLNGCGFWVRAGTAGDAAWVHGWCTGSSRVRALAPVGLAPRRRPSAWRARGSDRVERVSRARKPDLA